MTAAQNISKYLADPSRGLPPPNSVADAVRHISERHETAGGSTFNRYFGDLTGQELYAVSLYPERTRRILGRTIDEERLAAFIANNEDLLADPRNSIGTWFSEDEGQTYLDVSVTLPDRIAALALGRRYNQVAIFDLARFETLDAGGTGEPPKTPLSVESRRLPPLKPKRRRPPPR